jgi:transposase
MKFATKERTVMARITRVKLHISIEEVKERMLYDPRPWCRQRWLIIYNAMVDPREAVDIAKHTGASIHTVHKLIPAYNRVGVAAVETPGRGGRRYGYLTLDEERDFLTPFFECAERGELTTVQQIKQAFEERVGNEVDESTIHRLLNRHQWRKLVPRPFHPQADQEEQEQFKQNFPKIVEEAVKTKDPEDKRPLLLMAEDEACFGRISIPKRSWAPKHMRPRTPRQIVREYTYAYAAIAPEKGEMTSLVLPYSNTEMMNIFLKHVSSTFSEYFIVMQTDQAGWHSSKDLVIPPNIRLISQPAYSPELNPVEHLWEELREKDFPNRAFSSLDAVVDALCNGLQRLEQNSKLLRSMTYFPHFKMVS